MKTFKLFLVLLLWGICVAGCGNHGDTHSTPSVDDGISGSVGFNIDFQDLTRELSGSRSKSDTVEITGVDVTLTRDGYDVVEQSLAVNDNVAYGVISDLAAGYWHVTARVYDNVALIFTGSVDVKIIAGAQVNAEILFDPVDPGTDPEAEGSVSIRVGLNPFPGYKKITHHVSDIFQDTINNKFYIYDSSLGIVAVYNAETLIREKDIQITDSPETITLAASGGALYLGYSSGRIYRLDTDDETFIFVADSLLDNRSLIQVGPKYLLASNSSYWGPSNNYKVIDLNNGQIIDSKEYWYPLSQFELNPVNGVVYAVDSGLSPADLHYIKINPATGKIDAISESRYHGDYGFGYPIRVIKNGSRIATSSGNMFISSALANEDITYAGNLGHSYVDLAPDDSLGNLYMLNSDGIKKLLVIDQDTFFVGMSLDVAADPRRVFNTANGIVVFVSSDSDYYAKIFDKAELGLE